MWRRRLRMIILRVHTPGHDLCPGLMHVAYVYVCCALALTSPAASMSRAASSTRAFSRRRLFFFAVQALSFCKAFVAPQWGGPASISTVPCERTPTTRISTATGWRRPSVGSRLLNSRITMAGDGGKTRVLFVCLGNICRSPTAEAVFKQVTSNAGDADKFDIESCGTGGGNPDWYKEGGQSYHTGDPPDARMTAAAAKRGVMLGGASRPLKPDDFEEFDLVVGMDAANAKAMSTAAAHWGKSEQAAGKVRTMTSYCRSSGDVKSVPDPYYGGPQGFETVLDLLDDACQGLREKCLAGDA